MCYVLEFRLREESVNSYDTYCPERDRAEYVNNRWKPLLDWAIDVGVLDNLSSLYHQTDATEAGNKIFWNVLRYAVMSVCGNKAIHGDSVAYGCISTL